MWASFASFLSAFASLAAGLSLPCPIRCQQRRTANSADSSRAMRQRGALVEPRASALGCIRALTPHASVSPHSRAGFYETANANNSPRVAVGLTKKPAAPHSFCLLTPDSFFPCLLTSVSFFPNGLNNFALSSDRKHANHPLCSKQGVRALIHRRADSTKTGFLDKSGGGCE